MSKTLHRNLQAKIAALQGPEWDSSDEDENEPTGDAKTGNQEQGKDSRASKTSATATKKSNRINISKDNNDGDDTVLYIGHLPKEFEERDLIQFLSQFGKVVNCRVARKIETGNPKGFAFARFEDKEVAEIACETLHGYFLGRQRLVCHLRQAHQGMFFDTDTAIGKHKRMVQLAIKQRDRNLANAEKLKVITVRLLEREQKKREKLKSIGIDYDFPGYKASQMEYEVQLDDANRKHGIGEKDEIEKVVKDQQHRGKNDSVEIRASGSKKARTTASASDESGAKKSTRKESIDSADSAKKTKRKDSIDSVGKISSDMKKQSKRRKDSIDSAGSATKRMKASEEESEILNSTPTPSPKSKSNAKGNGKSDASHHVVGERLTKSAKKDKKKKGSRRVSAP